MPRRLLVSRPWLVATSTLTGDRRKDGDRFLARRVLAQLPVKVNFTMPFPYPSLLLTIPCHFPVISCQRLYHMMTDNH